jgi:ABC-type branched-subunit amino acid transport system substrate-binding protein
MVLNMPSQNTFQNARYRWLLGGLLVLALAAFAQAEPGLGADTVRLGVMMPFTGDLAEVGSAYVQGARAAAEEINRRGGVAGRKIQLMPVDTTNVAADALAQVRDVLRSSASSEQVFALLGTVGLPSAQAVLPELEKSGIALIGPVSGLLARQSESRELIFPVRRPDEDVSLGLIKLLDIMTVKRLAIVHPRTPDATRQVQLLRDAAKAHGVTVVAQVDVGDTNIDLKTEVANLSAAHPDVILSLGWYQMTEALVRQMRAAGYKGLFAAHSDVGTLRLMASLKEMSRGLGVASGLPSPYSNLLPMARDYRAAFARVADAQHNAPDEASFEGYLAVRVFADALRQMDANPTRRGLQKALIARPLEIAGLVFDYRSSTSRGLQTPGSMYVMTGKGRVSQ